MYHSAGQPSKKSNQNNSRSVSYFITRVLLALILLVPAAVFCIDGVDHISRYDLFSYQWFDAVAKLGIGVVFTLLTCLVIASIARKNIQSYLVASILAVIWLLANAFVIYGLVMPDVVLGTFDDGTKRGLASGNAAIFYVVLALIVALVDILPVLLSKNMKIRRQSKK